MPKDPARRGEGPRGSCAIISPGALEGKPDLDTQGREVSEARSSFQW